MIVRLYGSFSVEEKYLFYFRWLLDINTILHGRLEILLLVMKIYSFSTLKIEMVFLGHFHFATLRIGWLTGLRDHFLQRAYSLVKNIKLFFFNIWFWSYFHKFKFSYSNHANQANGIQFTKFRTQVDHLNI